MLAIEKAVCVCLCVCMHAWVLLSCLTLKVKLKGPPISVSIIACILFAL